MSRLLRHHILFVVAGVVAWIVGLRMIRRTEKGQRAWERFVLSLPVFGVLIQKVALARFAEAMAQMLANGIPILRALALSGGVMQNKVMSDVLVIARKDVEEGKRLTDALANSQWYPPLLVHMIATGEKTGKMDDMLERVAAFYRNEVSVMLKGLTSLVEPLLIVFLGVLIGGMVICMFIPIFKLHELVNF
jgi:type IV pilus assembly protein PilC